MYEKFVFDLVKNLEGIKKKIKLKRISLKEDVPLNWSFDNASCSNFQECWQKYFGDLYCVMYVNNVHSILLTRKNTC